MDPLSPDHGGEGQGEGGLNVILLRALNVDDQPGIDQLAADLQLSEKYCPANSRREPRTE